MKPSKVLLISIFITAIILVVIGGVTSNVLANKTQAPAVDQETIQAMQDREVTYNQLIEQANQQLAKANADLQAMQTQVNQIQQQKAVEQQAPVDVAISVKKASEIASGVAGLGQKQLRDPELVEFEGKTAYEIPYDKGSIYVEAQTGEVLFNGTVPQEIKAEKAAQIAAEYMKNPNVLQVDEIPFRGAQIYRVILSDGNLVFIDKTGQILFIEAPRPRAEAQQISSDSGGGSGGGGRSSHEREHEDEHDDD